MASAYAIEAISEHSPIEAWIVDDTGMLKQGTHSVGVQRQYTGSAGKVANCQIAVSLSVATHDDHAPIDFELYMPRTWTDDASRRRTAHVPDTLEFKTKPELALDMIRRAVKAKVPRGVLLADAAYGSSVEFRKGVRDAGLHFAVGIDPKTSLWLLDVDSNPSAGASARQPASTRNVSLELRDALVARVDCHGLGAALLGIEGRQLATLGCGTPRKQVRRIQALTPQQRAKLAATRRQRSVAHNAQLIRPRETAPNPSLHDLGRRALLSRCRCRPVTTGWHCQGRDLRQR